MNFFLWLTDFLRCHRRICSHSKYAVFDGYKCGCAFAWLSSACIDHNRSASFSFHELQYFSPCSLRPLLFNLFFSQAFLTTPERAERGKLRTNVVKCNCLKFIDCLWSCELQCMVHQPTYDSNRSHLLLSPVCQHLAQMRCMRHGLSRRTLQTSSLVSNVYRCSYFGSIRIQ